MPFDYILYAVIFYLDDLGCLLICLVFLLTFLSLIIVPLPVYPKHINSTASVTRYPPPFGIYTLLFKSLLSAFY
jgi:ABC-type uncharacterized transport system permease subunit